MGKPKAPDSIDQFLEANPSDDGITLNILNPLIQECPHCHEMKDDIQERYSFGVYAGKFCRDCCKRFRDHCGIDQPQGSPNDLDEQYEEDY